MVKRINEKKSNRIRSILSGFILILSSAPGIASLQQQQLTQAAFSKELSGAYNLNNDKLATSLIMDHRLFVKQFVDGLIKESIYRELHGQNTDGNLAQVMAYKAAARFDSIFGEKSLTIAVNYLTAWTNAQKVKKLQADSIYALGTKFRIGKEYDKAIEQLQNALELYQDIHDERGEAEVLGGLGAIYFTFDYQKCMSYYQEALIKREKVDDKQLIGNTLNSFGSANYEFFHDYPKALQWYDKAEALRTEIGDLANLKTTLIYKTNSYKAYGGQLNDAGNYPEALIQLEKALLENAELKNRKVDAEVISQMGFVYSNLGDYKTAVGKLDEALTIMREINDSLGIAGVYNHFGIVLQHVGRTEKALEYYNNSMTIYEKYNDLSGTLPVLSNLGTLFFDMKDYAKAEDYHKRGLQISRELKQKKVEVDFLLNLANDQIFLGKLDESMSNYKDGLAIVKSSFSPHLTWRILAGMAENLEQREEYDKAVELNDSSLKVLEGIRNTLQGEEFKASFMAKERYIFEDIINLLRDLHNKFPDKGYDIQSFQYAERSKSRAFLDLLAESLANVKEGANSELLKKQDEILVGLTQTKQYLENVSFNVQTDKQTIKNLKEKIIVFEKELAQVKKDIRSTNPGYAGLKYPEPVSLKDVQEMCPDKNTVFLEYSVGDSSSCLWVITKSDHQIFRLPESKKLQEQIETIRFALLDPKQGASEFFTRTGYSLYEELIKPAEPYFSKKSKLVIIPDGILNYLPFEVLLTENNGIGKETSYSALPFLVKKYPVSYGQSASVLKSLLSEQHNTGESVSDGKKLIAFGDPVYENANDLSATLRKSYSRLEYSGKEVEKIASYFNKGSTEIYLRNDATEENVKKEGELKKFNYVHFATHGIIDEEKPDFSSLVLTQEKNSEEDGFLQANEIFNLNLDADMVVLSACQTGLGKLIRGEGMVGLTRAFMYAGTPSVLVSLWSVSDNSTATLMGEFYKSLVKEKLSKTDALRKAQLSLLRDEKFAHPFYWAPFVLFGDWR